MKGEDTIRLMMKNTVRFTLISKEVTHYYKGKIPENVVTTVEVSKPNIYNV